MMLLLLIKAHFTNIASHILVFDMTTSEGACSMIANKTTLEW